MKKIGKILLFVVIILLITLINKDVMAADNEMVEFNNFDYEVSKIRERGNMKVLVKLSWNTNVDINIDQITITIADELHQDSVNLKPVKKEKDGIYYYQLNLTIQNWQVGTMKVIFKYTIFDSGNVIENNEKTIYLAADKWIAEEVGWGKAFLIAGVVTLFVGIGTFIIIENSKKEYLEDSDN